MTNVSRRKLIKAGVAAATGVAGLGVAASLAKKYGLIDRTTLEFGHRRSAKLCFLSAADLSLDGG